jgi:predicted anti-sigma-YlaC factor YlaD
MMSSFAPRAILCDRTRERVALSLDGELSEFEAVQAKVHLDACEACRAFAADVAAITLALRTSSLGARRQPIQDGRGLPRQRERSCDVRVAAR